LDYISHFQTAEIHINTKMANEAFAIFSL